MFGYIVRRILTIIPVLLIVTIIVFGLMHISGDPVKLLYGPNVSQEKIVEKRKELGLDEPVYVQYFEWVTGILKGDFGTSITTQGPVLRMIIPRIPATLELTLAALFITLIVSMPTGVMSAAKQYTIFDNVSRFFAIFWVSMPYFWLGLVFILFFGIKLQILPIAGKSGPIWTATGLLHLILPALTLGLPPAARFTRMVRSSMLEVTNEEFIKTARSKGLKEQWVILKHALRNAMISVITLLGLRIPWLFGGAVITETVFAWPGMGRLLIDAVTKRDYPVVQGIVLLLAGLVVLGNLTADLLYAYIDPRIRYD